MNIAFFTHYFTPEIGAPSARIHDLARQWLATGHEVQVVTCLPNHPGGVLYPGYKPGRYQHETLEGISVHRHWTYITPNKGFFRKTLGHASYWPSALAFSVRHLRRPDVAIGTSPTFFAAMAARRVAKKLHIPFVMEVRDLWPAALVELGVIRQRLLVRLLERWELSLYRAADRIVTVTQTFRDNLISRGVPASKVVSIPNGADGEFWSPRSAPAKLRTRLGLDAKFVVLYIGAHGISQALSRVLESAALLKSNEEIRFVLVGEGAEKAELMRYAEAADLTNVLFLDPVDKTCVRDFYALADVCLVPLRNIPLFKTFIPSKMFEMMAMGRAIVASMDGEAAEILRASGAATVVEPEDSRAIARAVLELFSSPQQLRSMGERGRPFVLKNYSRDSLAAHYIETIQETRAGSRPTAV